MSFRTHTIHSPDRGNFSRLPENMARINRGRPRPRLRVKKTRNPSNGDPRLATQVSNPRTKGPMHGRRHHSQGQAHEQAAEVACIGFGGGLRQAVGQAQFPEAEEAGGKKDHDCGHRNQHQGILQQRSHEAAG